jgi:hypothetical protein
VRDLPQASKLYSEARRILESVTENQPMVLPAKHRVLGVLARQRAILKLTSGTQEIVENLRESVVLTELIVEVWPRDEAWLYYLARLYSRLWGSAFIARNYVLAKDACERGSTIIQALRNASPTNERYIAAERTYEKGLA